MNKEEAVEKARKDLAQRLKVDAADIKDSVEDADFPDMALLRRVGLPVAVGNAVPEVRAVCGHQLSRHGGRGAIREFVEDFLKARGEWDIAWNRYVDARSRSKSEVGA